MESTREEHESYGIMQVTRVHGGKADLFMSEVKHPHRLAIRLYGAVKERSLNEDKAYPRELLYECHMSEAQFARLLSSVGMGSGVPATIVRRDGKMMDDCPPSEQRETFHAELRAKVRGISKKLSALRSDARDILCDEDGPKGGYLGKADREKLLKAIAVTEMEVNSNLPFLLEQLKEKLDSTIHDAKTNIESFAGRAMDRIRGAASVLKEMGYDGELTEVSQPLELEVDDE